ncbi:MAG: aldehyde ferredoxin oxidoreductase N-terminal domain-containing protein [Promethearchaeota archaeon]
MTRTLSVLEFDLMDEVTSKKSISPEIVDLMGEGRGLGVLWMFQHSINEGSSLTDQEALIIVTGKFGQAWGIVRSPINHILDIGLISGTFGPSLRCKGISLLSIKNKARETGILLIEDDKPKLIFIPDIKGKTTEQTESVLIEKFGSCSNLLIGSAADKGVRFASAFHEACIVGKMGFGQVMASKSLKAIVVKNNLQGKKKKQVQQNSVIEKFSKRELSTLIATHGYLRFLQDSSEVIQSLFDLSTYPSTQAKLDWFLGSLNLGPLLDIYDVSTIMEGLKQCWDAGLDPIAVGSIFGSIARLNEIKKASPHPEIRFGSNFGLKFISMIGSNSRFGKELAFGPEQIMTLRGEKPLTLRGVPLPSIHFGRSPFLALSLASGPMMSSSVVLSTLFLENKIFQKSWNHWNKTTEWLNWWHKLWIGLECFGIDILSILSKIDTKITSVWKIGAKFALRQMLNLLFPEKVIQIPKEKILKVGERTILLERLFNSRQGFTAEDERLPVYFFSKRNEGTIERKQFFDTRSKYFQGLLINRVGMPTLEALKRLELDRILKLQF